LIYKLVVPPEKEKAWERLLIRLQIKYDSLKHTVKNA
jgi:hypothetical protein